MSVNNSFELPTISMDFNTLISNPVEYVQQQQQDMAKVALHLGRRKLLNEGGGFSVTEVAEEVKRLSVDSETGVSKYAYINGTFVNNWLDTKNYQGTTIRSRLIGNNQFFRHATPEAERNAWCCVSTDTPTARALAWHPSIAEEIIKDLDAQEA